MNEILDAIPSSWCDSLLTGPDAVIGEPPYNCQDIERLLNGIREQIKTIVSRPAITRKPTSKELWAWFAEVCASQPAEVKTESVTSPEINLCETCGTALGN